MGTVPFSLRLDEDVKASLEAEARRQDRSASYLASRAIKEMLQAKAAGRRIVDEAIAEADKGVFISEERMNAWFQSLGTANELPEPVPDVALKGE